ncbi:hypothetical protein R3P38DRAFT_518162 [Favolaschia claudopus]|uniref:Uncharacterized protein n=1 Tax=Favolaschia claudopus TaxID=2862362 RepID=A0AAV9ZBP7_9AGAR
MAYMALGNAFTALHSRHLPSRHPRPLLSSAPRREFRLLRFWGSIMCLRRFHILSIPPVMPVLGLGTVISRKSREMHGDHVAWGEGVFRTIGSEDEECHPGRRSFCLTLPPRRTSVTFDANQAILYLCLSHLGHSPLDSASGASVAIGRTRLSISRYHPLARPGLIMSGISPLRRPQSRTARADRSGDLGGESLPRVSSSSRRMPSVDIGRSLHTWQVRTGRNP